MDGFPWVLVGIGIAGAYSAGKPQCGPDLAQNDLLSRKRLIALYDYIREAGIETQYVPYSSQFIDYEAPRELVLVTA